MNFENKLITLTNGKKYIVIVSFEYEKKQYLYLTNKENSLDAIFAEVDAEKNQIHYDLDPEFIQKKLFPIFVEKIVNSND